ncbi:MAG TPA: sigma 54-interacting transcriptional regulator [Burkholderiales bacterium]|nr:sigma 54-interacting transcriptional regulator [Burkholderiales bacterium]
MNRHAIFIWKAVALPGSGRQRVAGNTRSFCALNRIRPARFVRYGRQVDADRQALKQCFSRANRCRALLFGESGTGKELFAPVLHLSGARRDHPAKQCRLAAWPPFHDQNTPLAFFIPVRIKRLAPSLTRPFILCNVFS